MGAGMGLALFPLLLAPPQAVAAEEAPAPSTAPTILPGERVVVHLLGGGTLEGGLKELDPARLVLASTDGDKCVPYALVERIEVAGQPLDIPTLQAGWAAWTARTRQVTGPTPAPWAVGVASGLWAGAGFLALGETREFVGYSLVEAAFVGTGYWFVQEDLWGQLVPLVLLDVTLRIAAAGDAVGEARWRRRLLSQTGPAALTVPPESQ